MNHESESNHVEIKSAQHQRMIAILMDHAVFCKRSAELIAKRDYKGIQQVNGLLGREYHHNTASGELLDMKDVAWKTADALARKWNVAELATNREPGN